ncbi:MAG: hypothetical protein PHD67_01405 [Oscillospiraceae bacterium]|nr:hypothetical protein [Oscillospiraceae bacterium]
MRKIEPQDYAGKGISGRPNPLGLQVAEAQRAFDEMALDVLIPIFNENMAVLEELELEKRVYSQDIRRLRLGADGVLETSRDGETWVGAVAADHVTVTIPPKYAAYTLPASGWAASGENFVQTVSAAGMTEDTLIILLPAAAQIAQLSEDGVTALIPESGAGTVTVMALGAAPTADMTLAAVLQEVESV